MIRRKGILGSALVVLVAAVGVVGVFGSSGCGGGGKATPAGGGASSETPAAPAAPVAKVAEKVAPYTYPAPVKGHFKEVNTGDFDLVDGIASGPAGSTVVFVVAKPIASPALAAGPCPMTSARALMALRNAGWVEVTLDEKGRSKYFAQGVPFGGSGREEDLGSHPWKSQLRVADGRAVGSVEHRHDGKFQFDLPRSSPPNFETTESDWFRDKRGDPGAPAPAPDRLASAYDALHKAAAGKDLKGFLLAQGFGEKEVAAIRGLDGIDADFAAYADRFLTPGQGGEPRRGPGWASIRSEGVDSKGAKFANYYWFASCGDRLILTRISVNPQ